MIVRDSKNCSLRSYSSALWAEGAMRQMIRDIKNTQTHDAEEED